MQNGVTMDRERFLYKKIMNQFDKILKLYFFNKENSVTRLAHKRCHIKRLNSVIKKNKMGEKRVYRVNK